MRQNRRVWNSLNELRTEKRIWQVYDSSHLFILQKLVPHKWVFWHIAFVGVDIMHKDDAHKQVGYQAPNFFTGRHKDENLFAA